ncbi:MAG: fumarate hydratase [Candidatus Marinimicrobia bacterium]|nr:fumarate hydratase [Candidatus Neomarinimicrobiota bacterium]
MQFEFNHDKFRDASLELIRLASTDMAPDVVRVLEKARDNEDEGSAAKSVLAAILRNIKEAREASTPICQDTGTNINYIMIPEGVSMRKVQAAITEATQMATEKSYLRPNSVDPVTGKNSGDNTGIMAPYFHFEEWDEDAIEVKLALKGGGSENVSGQYKLPDTKLKAGRNLDGVYKCVVDMVFNAQGQGCAPGIMGIGIGGDRASSMIMAKKQLFRKLDDTNPDSDLAPLEERLLTDLNKLGVGPMGFGGKTTALAVKIGKLHRLPASFFVSLAYMCWADRRHTMTFSATEVTYD